MLAGRYLHKDRYAKYLADAQPVVFICRDQAASPIWMAVCLRPVHRLRPNGGKFG